METEATSCCFGSQLLIPGRSNQKMQARPTLRSMQIRSSSLWARTAFTSRWKMPSIRPWTIRAPANARKMIQGRLSMENPKRDRYTAAATVVRIRMGMATFGKARAFPAPSEALFRNSQKAMPKVRTVRAAESSRIFTVWGAVSP